MKIRIRKKNYGVTMFAMPDIAFLLLIFLILTVSVDEYGDINLPNFKFLQETDYPEIVVVNISAEGLLGIGGEYMNNNLFKSSLDQIPQNTIIHLIADKNCSYSDVDEVLGLLQREELSDVVLIMDENPQQYDE